MAKLTLLEMTQDILSDIDGDEVNSISDTIEATQVATVIRNTYRNVVEEYDLQATEVAFQLTASGTSARPTHMTIPSSYHDISCVKYDTRVSASDAPSFTEIPYATPAEFLERVSNNDTSASDYDSVTDPDTSFVLAIRNDHAPSMWTSLDGGDTIIFDSYNSALGATLVASKTQCLGRKRQDITLTDSATLEIPESMTQLVYNQAREVCMDLFKDGAPRSVNETARISRMRAKERKQKISTPAYMTLPDYGRK